MSSRRLKYLIKSKSLSFVKNLKDKSHKINSILWNGKEVFYRSSSSDMILIYEILLQSKYKSEYFFPNELNPKVILDIGGNIGITSIYLSSIFPDAKIYTFEPIPDNFEILTKNIQKYDLSQMFHIFIFSHFPYFSHVSYLRYLKTLEASPQKGLKIPKQSYVT